VSLAEKLLRKCAVNVFGRVKGGFVMSALSSMSVAETCSCQWLIPHVLECVVIQDRNMMHAERQIIRCLWEASLLPNFASQNFTNTNTVICNLHAGEELKNGKS